MIASRFRLLGGKADTFPALFFLVQLWLRQFKSLVALGRDLVALLPVTADAFRSQIRQKGARLAGDVGAHVPGIGARHQRRADDFIDMGDPLILRRGRRLDGGLSGLAHGFDAVGDPLDMLLDRYRHVRQHRRALWAGDGEQVGKAGDRDAKVGVRAVDPLPIQRAAAAAFEVQGLQRAGHGIETGGENDDVERIYLITRADTPFGDFLNPTVGFRIDQGYVGLVEGLVVVGVQRLALGAVGVALGNQLLGDGRVFHGLADLALDVVGAQVIGLLREEHVLIVGQPKGEPAGVPHPVELTLSLFGRGLQRRLRQEVMLLAEERFPDPLGDALIIRLSRPGQFGVHLAIARRYAVVGGALENDELFGLLRNFGNGLHRRGAGTYHAHALAGEVNASVREAAGVVALALEFLQALQLRHVRGRQGAYGCDEITCRNLFVLVGTHRPQAGCLVEFRACHAGIELNVAFEVVAFGNMLEITQDFGLLGIAFGPFPLLQELLVPGETINVGVGIATRTGVAVPVPGAAYGFTGFINPHLQSQFVP